MLSKRTVIGIAVGIVVMSIGVAALIQHIGLITIEEEQYILAGDSARYAIPAPGGTGQSMRIAGDTFNVTLSSPGDGLQIPNTAYREDLDLDWTHAADGETRITIANTGGAELQITGTLVRSADPIWLTFDLMVIISGMVIIGFSMGFTMRRPKGF